MIDPMAGLIAAGAAKQQGTPVVEGEVLTAAGVPVGISACKRAIIDAATEVLGVVTGNAGRMPWGMRAVVEVMTRQVRGGLLAEAVASMDEGEVRRLVTEVRDRAEAALSADA